MDFGENEWLQDIREQTKRLADLTGSLVMLSRMEEGQNGNLKVEFPLSDMVEEVCHTFQAPAKIQGICMKTAITPMISIKGDEKAIRSLITILLDNAVKYTNERGRIDVTLGKKKNRIYLSVFNTTEYISKEEMDTYLDDTMGNFVGIGIYMIKNTQYDKIQVLSTIKGSPAEKAGIQAGDLIISADGVEYSADDMTTASNKIKGEEGTKVTIEVLRGAEKLKFELTREKVKVNQVEGKVLSNNIGYIKFTSFDETTAEDFKNQYQELAKKGIQSLIIDLRNNGGGIVDQALEIADYMTPKDSVLLYEVDKNGKETVKKAKEDPIVNMPIVILTNENTASASEILAGALKDLGKAKIVGTTTYGKGVIQQILKLNDGSGLKITIEEYQTPNRNKINKVGIQPDEKVELPSTVNSLLTIKESDDTQLQKAIEMLK